MAELKDLKRESSLIERAVEKLAENPTPKSALAPEAPRIETAPATSKPQHAVLRAEEPAAQPEVLRRKEPVLPTQEHGETKPAQKKIQINFQRLQSYGIFSPLLDTNRTTEEFRLVKRSVLLNVTKARQEGAKNPNLIMVTSARQGEGKSFTAFNLAMSIAAETDTTVLLIDADATRSSVVKTLGIQAHYGLLDLLRDNGKPFSDAVLKTDIERLSILPAGPPDPLSTEILAGTHAADLLQEISQRYKDRVIILDAPPVLATSEPSALALHAGQIVFVVDAQKTTKSAVKEALNLVGICSRIGFVLNRAEFEIGSARFGSYYQSYKDSYSSYAKSRKKHSRKIGPLNGP